MNFFDHCPLCGTEKIFALKGFEQHCLYRCDVCSLVFDQRIPNELELAKHYEQYSYSSLKECSLQTLKSYNRLLDEFEIYRQTGNILDVGCGQGDFLCEASKRGWSIYGTEYSNAAVRLCLDRGINVCEGELEQKTFDDKQFDVITSFEVIEHLNDPNGLLGVVKNKLRSKGLFYCTTPNFNSILRHMEKASFSMICYPEHLSFYSKRTFFCLAKKHRFELNKILTTGLDVGRMKKPFSSHNTHANITERRLSAKKQTDSFRAEIDSNIVLGVTKNVVNRCLSIAGMGDTLKAYMVNE